MASCSELPATSLHRPKARPRQMLAAAGIVVTEMNTPTRPLARWEVSARTPAAAAMTATMNDHTFGV